MRACKSWSQQEKLETPCTDTDTSYIIIAVAFYVYPDNAGDITGLVKSVFAGGAAA